LVSANKKSTSWFESNRLLITIAGAAAGLLALIGVALVVLKRRKGSTAPTEILGQQEPTVEMGSPAAGAAPGGDASETNTTDSEDITKKIEPDDR
jgi:hypothetical protein